MLKIQQAVILLDGAKVPAGESGASLYGPSTAAAVLAYKTKRNIVNRAYQSQPDNVVGKMTITQLDADMQVFEVTHPEVTAANESSRILALLDRERPAVGQMITTTLSALADVNAAFASPQSSVAVLARRRFTVDGLKRFFNIDQSNRSELTKVIANFQAYAAKFPALKGNQRAADFATLLRDHPTLLDKGAIAANTPPAFSLVPKGMFFTPRYRDFDGSKPPLFQGLLPEALRGIQLHEMGHFHFGFIDGNPRGQTTSACLRLASGYDLLARQTTFQKIIQLP